LAINFGGSNEMAFIEVNGVNVHYTVWNEQASVTIVAFHGFTGSVRTWEKVALELGKDVRFIAIDLLGHGQTSSPADVNLYSMESQVELLHDCLQQIVAEPVHLLGYSMGGRVALSYAVKHPTHIKSLLLESASPGLEAENARAERRTNDAKLANKIMQEGIESFIDMWENIPLFVSQKLLSKEVQQAVREERMNQKPIGLANSLLGMGTGQMPSVWHQLQELTLPVFLLTGAMDYKFVDIANKMIQVNENFTQITISGYGHAIHVENPQKFATIVKESILN
jgi:2-succinyl-6-hydroxy-2,4-cyclohexadiene-1-carboxylate synthase